MITKPTIHLNGTSRSALYEGYRTAYIAACEALERLQDCYPHARDYYVQGNGAFERARREHDVRLDRMRMVRQQLEELMLHAMGDGR